MKASATALHLTCTAQLNASAIQPYIKNDSDSEWYVVFAFAGQYDNETMFYREHFCATFRCFNETTCLCAYLLSRRCACAIVCAVQLQCFAPQSFCL